MNELERTIAPGVFDPASALPPRIRLREHEERHQEPEGPHRQEGRREAVSGERHPVDARHS